MSSSDESTRQSRPLTPPPTVRKTVQRNQPARPRQSQASGAAETQRTSVPEEGRRIANPPPAPSRLQAPAFGTIPSRVTPAPRTASRLPTRAHAQYPPAHPVEEDRADTPESAESIDGDEANIRTCMWAGTDPGPSREIVAHNALEEHFVSVLSDDRLNLLRLCPSTASLDAYLINVYGYNKNDLPGARKAYHERINGIIARGRADGNTIPMIGMKPKPGDLKGVKYITIEKSGDVVIRLSNGGLENQGLWLLDFYNRRQNRAVNSPMNWKITVIPVPATLGVMCPGELTSWEANSLVDPIPNGEERFSVPEGVKCVLERGSGEGAPAPVWFSVPERLDRDQPMKEYGVTFVSARDTADDLM